jgi:DNA-binding response OmpR family regulator
VTLRRLDQILDELGYVSDAELRLALKRQRTHGGRLGENLVQLGILSPRQLMTALGRQFGVPWRNLKVGHVPPAMAARLPPPGPNGSLAIPVGWSGEEGQLTVATNDPRDEQTLSGLREAFGARVMEVFLVPDAEIREVRAALEHGGAGSDPEDGKVIELPDLFAGSADEPDEGEEAVDPRSEAPDRRVLMVGPGAQRRSFLPAIFAREGCELVVVDGFDEVSAALAGKPFDAVLVDASRAEAFRAWSRRLHGLPSRIGVFPSVSQALVDNPVPYHEVIRSLKATAEALADARVRDREPPPPYGLMARDVAALAKAEGMRELAADGLHLALHLLVPPVPGQGPAESGRGTGRGPFEGFAQSRELAVRLRFPWPVEVALDQCLALFLGARTPESPGRIEPEVVRAAQVLALTWFHHLLSPVPEAVEGEEGRQMRHLLREAATRLASLDLVERYLRVIEERHAAGDMGEVAQVILVGGERATDLAARLARAGIHPVVTRDLVDAQAMAERRPPSAVIVDEDAVPGHVEHFARVAKLDAALLLYVVTDQGEATRTLGLLDAGADDVFGPPHDFDLVAARVARAIASRSKVRAALRSRGGDFSATFEAFSFLDLAQALAHGFKSVRVELTRGSTGEKGLLFLERGRPVHAVAGDLVGPAAVYRIISWEEDGEFSVHPESDFPEPTIADPIESLLMEGCRLLDESRA